MRTPRIRIVRVTTTIDPNKLGKKKETTSLRRTHTVARLASLERAEAEANGAAMAAEAEETELTPET